MANKITISFDPFIFNYRRIRYILSRDQACFCKDNNFRPRSGSSRFGLMYHVITKKLPTKIYAVVASVRIKLVVVRLMCRK